VHEFKAHANYSLKFFPLRPTRLPGYIRYRRTDGQTDRQTDDNLSTIG